MLDHDFAEVPSRSTEVGDNPHETIMVMKCKWCMRTPAKAREDGCPIHELEEVGSIMLADYNPDGLKRFAGRMCVTCDRPIMGHELRHDSDLYWCYPNQSQFSEGITGCVFDIGDVKVPEEPKTKFLGGSDDASSALPERN